MRAVRVTDSCLRDGSHAVRHQLTAGQVRDAVTALDGAGVPVLEVAHGDGLGGSSFTYGFSKSPDRDLIAAAVQTARRARIAALLLPGIGTAEDIHAVAELGVSIVRIATQWYLSFAQEQLQREVRDSEPGLIVDSLVPGGQAEIVDGGYRLSGRWKFVSGIEWASWAGLGFVPPNADPPRPIVAFVPARELSIEDTGHTVGLRGTASNEITLEGAFIPSYRIFELAKFAHDNIPQGEVVEEGTLFKLPFMGMAAIHLAYTALGAAERAIEEFAHWTKVRVRAYEHTAAQEAPYSQMTLADAIAKWDAAHALMLQYVRDMWEAAEAGRGALPDDVRARMFAQRAFIARTCAELTNQLFLDSGAMSLFQTSAMQQLWRDANAASMHMVLGRGDALTSLGRTLMGLPGHPFA